MSVSAELRVVAKYGTVSQRSAARRSGEWSGLHWLALQVGSKSSSPAVERVAKSRARAVNIYALWRARYAMHCGEGVTLLEIRCSTCIYRNILCVKTGLLMPGLVFILPPLQ